VPPAAAQQPGAGRIVSTKLSGRGGTARVQLSCAGSKTSCAGTLSARSTTKQRIGKRSKIVTIAAPASYTMKAGAKRTVVLKLSRDARSVLSRRRSLRVRITLKPKRGAVVSRTVSLTR